MPFDGRFRHACFSHDFFARRKLAGFYKALTDKGLNSCTRRLPLNSLPSVRSLQFCKLRLRIVAITVFPALCGFLAASAAHRSQGFTLAAGGFTGCARAGVGLALGLGDIPAHAPCHGLAVTHGWHLVVAACPAVGICDVVAVLVSIDDRCVCQALSCRRKR